MNLEFKLTDKIIQKLIKLPETGMGYQVVDFILENRKIIENITVLNSSLAILDENNKEIIDQIIDVKLSAKPKICD